MNVFHPAPCANSWDYHLHSGDGEQRQNEINTTVFKHLLILGSCLEHTCISFPGNLLFLQVGWDLRHLCEAGTCGIGAWELFYGAILCPWLQGRLLLQIPSERRCLAAVPGWQPGLLGGVGFEPHLLPHCFPPVSIGHCSSCPVNFSPLVTNASHALCGHPRHPAPSSESTRYLHDVVQLLKIKYFMIFITSITFICGAVFYSPSLWSPVITWKSVLSFLCAEPAYSMLAADEVLKCTV